MRQDARSLFERCDALGAAILARVGFEADAQAWFSKFTRSELDELRVFGRAREGLGVNDFEALYTSLLHVHAVAGWLHSGRPIFRPTVDLCHLLRLTDLDDALPPMPFASFKVAIPPNLVPVNKGFAEEVWVTEARRGDAVLFNARIDTSNRTTFAVSWPWDVAEEDRVRATPTASAAHLHATTKDQAAMRDLAHMVRGLASYLAARPEPIQSENGRAVARDRSANRLPRPEIFVVGREVTLSPMLRAVSQEGKLGAPIWKLKHRFTVIGHWRWQPIGSPLAAGIEGPRNARKTWIMPYWKGPEGAEAWQHLYDVTAEHEVTL